MNAIALLIDDDMDVSRRCKTEHIVAPLASDKDITRGIRGHANWMLQRVTKAVTGLIDQFGDLTHSNA